MGYENTEEKREKFLNGKAAGEISCGIILRFFILYVILHIWEAERMKNILHENLVSESESVGKFQFPQIKPVDFIPKAVIPFSEVSSETNPRGKWVHFFIDDYRFERSFNDPERYMDMLKYFDGIITQDFSVYADMPLPLQIYNVWRNRAMAYHYQKLGFNIIPSVGWAFEDSYDWCFDGLPQNSTLAVSTNGCFFQEGKECYRNGMIEMCRRLNPKQIICIGREIPVPEISVPILYYESFGQQMSKRLKGA